MKVKKIVILGPESTGKSTLCEQLAQHYNTLWCPEYAREYLLKNGTRYRFEDLLTIAQGQLELEDRYLSYLQKKIGRGVESITPIPFFIDTDMYVMKVWCEFVFNKVHPFILQQIVARPYDLYLLCNIDLPWTKDELREYPDLASRKQLYYMYKDLLINQAVPSVSIEGNHEERFLLAKNAVDTLLKK